MPAVCSALIFSLGLVVFLVSYTHVLYTYERQLGSEGLYSGITWMDGWSVRVKVALGAKVAISLTRFV